MFKEKPSKRRPARGQEDKCGTMDARHQDMIQRLEVRCGELEGLRKRRAELEARGSGLWARIAELKAADGLDSAEYDDAWSGHLANAEALRAVSASIRDLETHRAEIGYYEDAGRILFRYYDMIEAQGGVGSAGPHVPRPARTKAARRQPPALGKDILEALMIRPAPAAEAPVHRSELVDEYLSIVDRTYVPPMPEDEEPKCGACGVLLLCLQGEGVMVCPECGHQKALLAEQNRMSLRPAANESSHKESYKRINHFVEWLNQIQGKESTDIPEEVFERILAEIKKEKIDDPSKITHAKMRELLRRLHLNRYYEHSAFLMQRITGVSPPHFPPELEEKLRQMFQEIQPAFVRHCPKSRRNFLSYSLCLHAMFRILGESDPSYLRFLPSFPLLRARDKLYAQQEIFRAICKDLGWQFFPCV